MPSGHLNMDTTETVLMDNVSFSIRKVSRKITMHKIWYLHITIFKYGKWISSSLHIYLLDNVWILKDD
jgi:hypothetical protein